MQPMPAAHIDSVKVEDPVVNSDFRVKFKTEMCKNWIEAGVCRYGIKCQFAHGGDELTHKVLPQNAKYKSKLCNTFADGLFCPYGNRCLFRHEDRIFSEVHEYHYMTKLCLADQAEYDDVIPNTPFSNKRLSVFTAIEEAQTLCEAEMILQKPPQVVECRSTGDTADETTQRTGATESLSDNTENQG